MPHDAPRAGLHDPTLDHDSCGVGFLTRKDGVQTHEVLALAHRALCEVPHRGGISAEGVGDGGGVCVDLSVPFFSALVGLPLAAGEFGVANVFLPADTWAHDAAGALVEGSLAAHGLEVLLVRDVPVDPSVLNAAAVARQLPVRQWVFTVPAEGADAVVQQALLAIEATAFALPRPQQPYPVSMSARTQVLKGRLSSGEVMRYFRDLADPRHAVHSLFFHTRFSTNTDPHATMAQPFRLLAHNGELNTDRKNRIAETALARARGRAIVRPPGQSDSCRLDQSLASRVLEDGADLVESVVAMMPPAWENDPAVTGDVRAMLEYFSLREEKNDGPAALVFGDGTVIGARLDRLGLRPLRTVETDEYVAVMSEAGQLGLDPATETARGRIEAGGMVWFDHATRTLHRTDDTLRMLAARRDYPALLAAAKVDLGELPSVTPDHSTASDLSVEQRHVACSLNSETFRFMLDPMLANGVERVSAMGYGNAINAVSAEEGGVARYFSQRFSQVTNPPLDSIREADGMATRVALGARPVRADDVGRQVVLPSPLLTAAGLATLEAQSEVPVLRLDLLTTRVAGDAGAQAAHLEAAIESLADAVEARAAEVGGIVVLSDRDVASDRPVLPLILALAAVNHRLVDAGLRLRVSLVAESGQLPSSHHVATALGFGASAVVSLSAQRRAETHFAADPEAAVLRFAKAAEKSLMKTMGRLGLCTVESYVGGEFFEPAFLDCDDPVLRRWLPNLSSPVGGATWPDVARSAADWHTKALAVGSEQDIPLLGLFKERSDGAGHSFGTAAVREFVDLTEEHASTDTATDDSLVDPLRGLTLGGLAESYGLDDTAYQNTGYDALTPAEIDAFAITPGYRSFVRGIQHERSARPAALRDLLSLPADVSLCRTAEELAAELGRHAIDGNSSIAVRGLACDAVADDRFVLRLVGRGSADLLRLEALGAAFVLRFGADVQEREIVGRELAVTARGRARTWLGLLVTAPASIDAREVEPASSITPRLASGAMSHGALVDTAHEAVAHGTNLVGGLSNCGEGGEHRSRYGTIRGSRIKQLASGRFGVWAGYLADPMLEELEIKIAQGAKPGEGGQLPAAKVTVDIAAARGATPGVELVSPPPHHDTYSIEDLAQLIHDCKAARVRVVVKLVSSVGIGTIAVGVAKAGADVINVAGNTGGTGAASVTSLKYAGRAAELGIAEVHQALVTHGLRDAVVLRCSGAHQCAHDVVTSALLGGDSFEFGTSSLMMLGCVMAKNCNLKCPAGLTTNPEVFAGDPRALAQYYLNIAHDVREILAELGLRSLAEARGRTDLLQLVQHAQTVGRLDVRAMLAVPVGRRIAELVRVPADFTVDEELSREVRSALVERGDRSVVLTPRPLGNRDKTVGGRLAIDVERLLNHELDADTVPAAVRDHRGRAFLPPATIDVRTRGSAGQSYGAFCNDGMVLTHTGTCNDGLAKSACGGVVAVVSPGGVEDPAQDNVLVGNFALFGATGGRTFVAGAAGDRFGVRNAGATAVVEGVGDFCCEYMTNGAVLNLGGAGKGLGNGMSGGFVYQLDPDGSVAQRADRESLVFTPLAGDEVHEPAARLLLEWHVVSTRSPRAAALLDDWETTREQLVVGTPRALLQYVDHTVVLERTPRSAMVDELARDLAAHQVDRFAADYRAGRPVLGGRAPGFGLDGPDEVHALLNSFTVMHHAVEVARSRVRGAAADDPRVQEMARHLLLTRDFFVVQRLVRHASEALRDHADEDLAVLVSAHRLRDYQRALERRNVLGIDAPGTYGWILANQRRHREAAGRLPGLEELFAREAVGDLVDAAADGLVEAS